jgi:hypothetical protein
MAYLAQSLAIFENSRPKSEKSPNLATLTLPHSQLNQSQSNVCSSYWLRSSVAKQAYFRYRDCFEKFVVYLNYFFTDKPRTKMMIFC